jgi:DNA polymerase III subunit beta
MKVVAKAGALAGALALAAPAMRSTKNNSAPVRLVAAGDAISITCADPNIALVTRLLATVIEQGETMLSADRLAALVAGFAAGAQLKIVASEKGATVSCGNSQYRLPVIPGSDLPAPLAIDDAATAEIEIGGDDVLLLLEPLYAAGNEHTRFNLGGVFLHSVGGRLAGVATDGARLCRVSVPAAEFSLTRDLILPSKPAATLRRVLLQMKPKQVTLRRSRTLIAFSGSGFSFTSRLIDSNYPDYEAVMPAASPNVITCARAELLAAVARLAAMANADPPLLALSWTNAGSLYLTLARQPGDASDVIAAEAKGVANLAVPLSQLMEMLNDFKAERIRFEAGTGAPLVVQGDGGAKLALLMPATWKFGGEEVLQ